MVGEPEQATNERERDNTDVAIRREKVRFITDTLCMIEVQSTCWEIEAIAVPASFVMWSCSVCSLIQGFRFGGEGLL